MVSSCLLRLTILLSRLGPWFERREPGNTHNRTQVPFENIRFPQFGFAASNIPPPFVSVSTRGFRSACNGRGPVGPRIVFSQLLEGSDMGLQADAVDWSFSVHLVFLSDSFDFGDVEVSIA